MSSYNPHAKESISMFERIIAKHPHDILTARMDWGVIEYRVPGYDGKIQEVVPYTVIDFKY